MMLHYSVGIAAIVFAALSPVYEDTATKALLSAGAVICASLVTFLSARKTSFLYWQAWRALDLARMRYEIDQTITDDAIYKIIELREKIIESSETDMVAPPE
jgi:hypothetical protein